MVASYIYIFSISRKLLPSDVVFTLHDWTCGLICLYIYIFFMKEYLAESNILKFASHVM
jgi:hypothetical protein